MHKKRMVYFIAAAIALILSGCGTPLPKYVEPNPDLTKVARLRVTVPPGVGLNATIYPDNTNACVSNNGAQELPVHTNTSGMAGNSTKLIGMPYTSPWGSEFNVPADQPLTIQLSYSGSNGRFSAYCIRAFRFTPEAQKDYQMFVMAGIGDTNNPCIFEFGELKQGQVDSKGTPVLSNVRATPVWVEGTQSWKRNCPAASEKTH